MNSRDVKGLKSKLLKHALQLQAARIKAKQHERSVVEGIAALTAPFGSAKQLADALSISGAYVCDIGYGRRGVGDTTLEKLITWLEVGR
jgi:hypothetical protein